MIARVRWQKNGRPQRRLERRKAAESLRRSEFCFRCAAYFDAVPFCKGDETAVVRIMMALILPAMLLIPKDVTETVDGEPAPTRDGN